MNNYWSRLGILGSVVFLTVFVTSFPARIAAEWARDGTGIPLSWQNVDGTVLDAELLGVSLYPGTGMAAFLDRITLETSLFSLLLARVKTRFAIMAGNSRVDGTLGLGIREWGIPVLDGTINLDELARYSRRLALYGPGGNLSIRTEAIGGVYGSLPDTGSATLTFTDVALDLIRSSRPLGSYHVRLDTEQEGGLRAVIETRSDSSQLIVSGEAVVPDSHDQLSLRLQVWAASNAEPSVAEMVPLFGPTDNGRAQIKRIFRF